MKRLFLVLFAFLLLTNVSWASCPSGKEANDRTGHCESVTGVQQRSASNPTFDTLTEGYCYVYDKHKGLYNQFVDREQCDGWGGVLFDRQDCDLKDRYTNGSFCVKTKENENIRKVVAEYERREIIRKAKFRRDKILRAKELLSELGYFSGKIDQAVNRSFVSAIDQFVQSSSSGLATQQTIFSDTLGRRHVSEALLRELKTVVQRADLEAAWQLAQKKAEEEATAKLAQKKAEEETAQLLAKQKAEEEAARLLAKQKAEEETVQLLAKQKAEEEAAQLLAKQKAEEEVARILAEAERKRLEAETSRPVVKTLTVRSNVAGDMVYIDNVFKGSTRLDLDLPKGQHSIRIEKDGYEAYEETVNLTDNLIIKGHLEEVVEEPAQTTAVQTTSVDNSALDLAFWQSIQDSDDPDMYRAYIDQFPTGVYVTLAKIKLKKFGSDPTSVTKLSIPDITYGSYHALVIGNNDYDHLPKLKTAVNDADKVASVLRDDYGFSVKLLKNANRSQMLGSLAAFRKIVSPEDNFLLYYAGHGYLDKEANEGYWLPVDAEREDPTNWLQNDTIVAQVKGMQAKHVMVVADSCFSGTMTRGLKLEQRTPGWLEKMVKKKARTALTSGGLEPVMDSGGSSHSVFAEAFIRLLEENGEVLDASQLFSQLRPKVMVNSTQTPEYGNIHLAGHDGGDFLFVRR